MSEVPSDDEDKVDEQLPDGLGTVTRLEGCIKRRKLELLSGPPTSNKIQKGKMSLLLSS